MYYQVCFKPGKKFYVSDTVLSSSDSCYKLCLNSAKSENTCWPTILWRLSDRVLGVEAKPSPALCYASIRTVPQCLAL